MRTSEATVRLEANRLKFIKNGRRGSLLPFYELNENEKQFFIEELTRDVSVRRLNVEDPVNEMIFDKMMMNILNDWGVMCPHSRSALEETKFGYFCRTCGCDLVPVGKRKAKAVVK